MDDHGLHIGLDTLLATLRKHGVIEYNKDDHGTRIKFEASNGHGVFYADSADDELRPALNYSRTVAPESGVIDPQTLNMDDVLYGAK